MERFELPEGWEWRNIRFLVASKETWSQIKSPRKRFLYIDISSIDNRLGIITKTAEIAGDKAPSRAKRIVRTGDIIFATTRPYLKNIAIVPENLDNQICSTGFCVLRPKTNEVISKWLYFICRSDFVVDQVIPNQEKSTYPAVSDDNVLDAVIPIPPLAEQQRIVARVEELTRRVEEARRLRREAVTEILAFIPSFLGRLFDLAERKGWKKASLGNKNISAIIMGQSPDGSSYNRDGKGVPLLNGPTEFGAEHPTPMQWTTQPTRLCKEGDMLFCVRGSTTGRMNWADRQYCIGRGIAAIRPNEDNCLPKFLYAFVQTQSNAVLHYGEGGVFPNFNKDQLAAMEIPLLPIDEQRRIVQYLDNLQSKTEELKRLQTETESELASFTPALLAKAFRGEL